LAADFNGDGKLDLAMVTDPDGLNDKNFVSVLLGNGDGTFQAAVELPPPPFGTASLLEAGDFDGDGTVDLLVAGSELDAPILLMRGNGDGTFRKTEAYVSASPQYIATGDFQGTGRLSMAISNEDSENVSVLLNRTAPLANPQPTVAIALSSTSITVGASSTLTWSSTHATSCTASGAWSGTQPTSGTLRETPSASGSSMFALSCSGAGGTASASATLTVTAAPPAPTVAISASPSSITVGESSTLTWSSTNATSCMASGAWSGAQPISGTVDETPSASGSSMFALSCSGAGGTAMSSVTVNVAAVTVTSTRLSGKAGGGALSGIELLGLALLAVLRFGQARREVLASTVCVLGLAVMGSAARAQESGAPRFDWDHTYVGLRVGAATYDQNGAALEQALAASGYTPVTGSIDRHRTGGVLYAGVPVHRHLALEIGWADLGEYPVTLTTADANVAGVAQTAVRKLYAAGRAVSVGFALPLDLGPWLSIEPRLAALGFESKQTVYTPQARYAQTREGAGLDAGLGLFVSPLPRVGVGAAVDCFDIGGRCNVLLYSVAVEYRFGR
jgi:hypothetical protein